MPAPLFRLRNAQKTRDRRLDRLVSPEDKRSLKFGVFKLGKLRGFGRRSPRTYAWEIGAILDQGVEGACVGAGIGGELAAAPVKVRGVTMDWCRTNIYWEAQKRDPWPGGSYPDADPRYEGTSLHSGVKVIKGMGLITGYYWARTLDEVLYALSWLGPVVIAVNWYSGMSDTDRDGLVKVSGRKTGGHCVFLCGLDVKAGYVTFANSWGEDWGQKGTGKIRYADLARLLRENGEACVFEGRAEV